MKILVTGRAGQLGYELERALQGRGQVIGAGRSDMDLARPDQIRSVIRRLRPQLIINAAAYTQVDMAEREPELAYLINAAAPAVMAEEARAIGANMVHFSTDYVFDGDKQGSYVETDLPAPLNVYGASKLAGEQAVLSAGIGHLIIRTSWLYGMRGNNFLLTILRLARERSTVEVVADAFGAPTWSRTAAHATAGILARAEAAGPSWWNTHSGIYHVSARGQTSWHGFASAIVENAKLDCRVLPIAGRDYPGLARRPSNCVLCTDKIASHFIELPSWDAGLSLCLGLAGDRAVME